MAGVDCLTEPGIVCRIVAFRPKRRPLFVSSDNAALRGQRRSFGGLREGQTAPPHVAQATTPCTQRSNLTRPAKEFQRAPPQSTRLRSPAQPSHHGLRSPPVCSFKFTLPS